MVEFGSEQSKPKKLPKPSKPQKERRERFKRERQYPLQGPPKDRPKTNEPD